MRKYVFAKIYYILVRGMVAPAPRSSSPVLGTLLLPAGAPKKVEAPLLQLTLWG